MIIRFENHANPQTLKDGLDRSVVKNAIRNACNDLSTTDTFHLTIPGSQDPFLINLEVVRF